MNNDIVTKARLNAALGTEGNMGFEHNDIVTVDKMNEAIEEGGGGGGGDFSTAEVTVVKNGSDEFVGYIPHIETFPGTGEGTIAGEIILGAGESGTYTCVLYKGMTNFGVYNLSATLEGDAESLGDIVKITGNCTITLTDGT